MPVKELSVKLEGLELSDKEMASLEKDINAVVLRHIAATKQPQIVGSQVGSVASGMHTSPTTKINPQWLGIWLKTFANKAAVEHAKFNVEKTLGAHV